MNKTFWKFSEREEEGSLEDHSLHHPGRVPGELCVLPVALQLEAGRR